MYLSSESSELDIITRGGGEPREDSESGVIGVGGVSGDGSTDLSNGEGSGESGEGGRDSGRYTLTGETAGEEADTMVCDTEAVGRFLVTCRVIRVEETDGMVGDTEVAERSLVTRRVIRVETGNLEASEVRRLARLAVDTVRDRP
jgi:hypothetical protein